MDFLKEETNAKIKEKKRKNILIEKEENTEALRLERKDDICFALFAY